MDRIELQKQLAQVEQKLREEMDQVTRQRELLTKLASDGVEIEPAKMLLGRLESLLLAHLQQRERLRQELEKSNRC
jgi:hypothetical protein